jgi:hypothetical protein
MKSEVYLVIREAVERHIEEDMHVEINRSRLTHYIDNKAYEMFRHYLTLAAEMKGQGLEVKIERKDEN